MRVIFFMFAALFMATPVMADPEVAEKINKACQRHAVSLVARLKADVIDNMEQSASAEALRLATESCQAYFMREFGQGLPVTGNETRPSATASAKPEAAVADVEAEEKGSWFEEQIINGGNVERKDGHDRLMRRR